MLELENMSYFTGKNILITGGTGSLGNELIRILLHHMNPNKVIIFSRDEYKQSVMQEKFPKNEYKNIRFFLGDVRDFDRLNDAFRDVDIIFHAAALKQVPALEYNPIESIKTNINGSENVIRAAIKNNVKKVIAISTDKAVSPVNLYGATKLCAEKLFIAANNLSPEDGTVFSVARYGNVLGSRGSVLPLFLKQKDNFTITDKEMTRFTVTIEQAANFVLNCCQKMIGGEIFIPKLPSYNIMQLANIINPNAKINFIGIRPGEKLHECLIGENESSNVIEFSDFFIILSLIITKKNLDHKKNYLDFHIYPKFSSYTSNINKLISNDILEIYINNYIGI